MMLWSLRVALHPMREWQRKIQKRSKEYFHLPQNISREEIGAFLISLQLRYGLVFILQRDNCYCLEFEYISLVPII